MQGQKFGRLTVIQKAERDRNGNPQWLCQCDCGQVRLAWEGKLKSGHTKSCGCLKIDMFRARVRRHGQHESPTYSSWEKMISRCLNPNDYRYADYGGRGIEVCERWRDFVNFFEDMGERPGSEYSLDRIDVDGSYCPENCRWATRKEQQRNRRVNRLVQLDGETVTVTEAAELTGISEDVLRSRLRRGWDERDALTRPVARKGSVK